jgi:flavin reductase
LHSRRYREDALDLNQVDPDLFRRVMGCFATGVAVITTAVADVIYGMTANAFMSASLSPPLCVVSIRTTARMHAHLCAAGHYGASFLSEEQQYLSAHFAGRRLDRVRPGFVFRGRTPVLEGAAGALTADILTTSDCGDHTLFVGHIRHMEAAARRPLVFFAGHYAALSRHQRIEEIEPPSFW